MAHVADHLSVSALEQQYRSCTDVTAARHVQTIWLLAKGHEIAEVAATVSYAQRWVERLLARYNAQGPQALGDLRRRNGTSPSVLRPDLLDQLKDRLREPPPDGGLWTGPKVAAWMAGERGRAAVLPQRGWEALKAINWSVQKPRPRHPASATPEERETFKKKLAAVVTEEAAKHPDKPVEVWATDEHRIGLKPIIRRVWAPKGLRPIALGHHRYKGLSGTAFVQPISGETFWYISNGISKPFFAALLALFAREAGRGEIASSCSGSTTPAGTPRPTWPCRMGSGSSTCPDTRPNCSPPSTSGPSWMSRSRTATSRPSPISSEPSPSAVAFSMVISSNPAQPSTGGLSGSSGKSCSPRQQGDPGRATRPMSAAFVPDEGVAMRVPIDRRAVDSIGDLVPGLEAPARKRKGTQDLPPGLDQVEVSGILGLEHHLPVRMRQQE